MSLIVTGTIGIDSVSTPDGGHAEGVLGGSCSYFAAAAALFTRAPVRVVGVVGDDFPATMHDTLRSIRRIDLAGLEARKGSRTFRWGGRYRDNMDQRDTLFTDLNVVGEEPPKVPAAFKDSTIVFLANSHPAVQLGLLESLPKRALAVADTMDLWINVARDDLSRLLSRVDGLVLNYDEAQLLTGKRNTVAAARAVTALGPKFVVVKKGEHGCLFVHPGGIGALPAYPAETVTDPTGAGDAFAGGLMGTFERLGADSWKDPSAFRTALANGTVAASFTIESFSLTRIARVTDDEVEARASEYAAMIRV